MTVCSQSTISVTSCSSTVWCRCCYVQHRVALSPSRLSLTPSLANLSLTTTTPTQSPLHIVCVATWWATTPASWRWCCMLKNWHGVSEVLYVDPQLIAYSLCSSDNELGSLDWAFSIQRFITVSCLRSLVWYMLAAIYTCTLPQTLVAFHVFSGHTGRHSLSTHIGQSSAVSSWSVHVLSMFCRFSVSVSLQDFLGLPSGPLLPSSGNHDVQCLSWYSSVVHSVPAAIACNLIFLRITSSVSIPVVCSIFSSLMLSLHMTRTIVRCHLWCAASILMNVTFQLIHKWNDACLQWPQR